MTSPLLFLSHSGEDSGSARELARRLKDAGLGVWFDKDELRPGDRWMEMLEQALQRADAFAVYVGRSGVQRWVDREVRVAPECSMRDPSLRVVPERELPDPRPAGEGRVASFSPVRWLERCKDRPPARSRRRGSSRKYFGCKDQSTQAGRHGAQMNSAGLGSDTELLARVATLLRRLGPFTPDTPRRKKWRTTEQLANELELFGRDAVDHLDRVLREHEARCLDRLQNGLPPLALIRRAKYPDRTTALPLWGSVEHHGPPWAAHRPDRSDPPDDAPPSLVVSDTAPHVFLSHTSQDADLALTLAEALARMEIGSWRFETHIAQRGDIADCVREAIRQAACVVSLVTRDSIASLWVLTELHTSLQANRTVVLVIDAEDALLLQLLQSARFPDPDADFDMSVEYDREVVRLLKRDYGLRQSESRTARYEGQVADFLASLPSYLGRVSPGSTRRIWRPALAFPRVPARWAATVKLDRLEKLPNILERIGSNSA